jgi:(p)ppGpp synthase/HD superfamily hydrolase
MQSIAQTNIQLFNQLQQSVYSLTEVNSIFSSYKLAETLLSGKTRSSGKPYITHSIGTASILINLSVPLDLVETGLLHAVYERGDFSNFNNGSSINKRDLIEKHINKK